MTNSKDSAISSIRLISMLFIVACHIMQYLDCELAWWFNVGVQIFLCISGYLYSSKKKETVPFLRNNLIKILAGFYVVIIPIAVLLIILQKATVTMLLKQLLLIPNIPGGAHLWFLPTILLCYFITPLLHGFYEFSDRSSAFKMFTKTAFLLVAVFITFAFFIGYYNPAWISCYIVGFAYKKVEDKYGKIFNTILILTAAVLNAVQIFSTYIYQFSFQIPEIVFNYAHTFLGVSLFIIFKKLFKNVKRNKVLDFSDSYSYEIYLVHQFFILGPLTMMEITPYKAVNIVIILISVVIYAVVAKKISFKIQSKILSKLK